MRLGSGLSVFSKLRIGAEAVFGETSQNTYIKQDGSNHLLIYIAGNKAATFESDGGILHGSWNVESNLITSDRRLKTNIVPLQRTLRDVVAPKAEKKVATQSQLRSSIPGQASSSSDGALWLLRQLRPVSYSFRKGVDSKSMRFGFIADELESVVPEVVRRSGDHEVVDQKAVVYQDLIALLAAASQSQQQVIETQQSRIAKMETMQAKMETMQMQLLEKLTKLEQAKQEDASLKKSKKRRRFSKRTTTTTTANMTNATNTTELV